VVLFHNISAFKYVVLDNRHKYKINFDLKSMMKNYQKMF